LHGRADEEQYFAMFFIGAVGEELGWQGYAVPSLQTRYTALQTGLFVGLLWAAWHFPAYLQTQHGARWIAWQCAQTVLARLLMVWLSNNAGGSVFIAIVFHMMINVSEFMFPDYGSHYDPFLNTMVMAVSVGLALFLWGFQTLNQFRFNVSNGS
jgi:membrane protease YdiL (CAAX protease family)